MINENIRENKITPTKVQHRVHANHCWGCGAVRARQKPKFAKRSVGLCRVCMVNPKVRPQCQGVTTKGNKCMSMAVYGLDKTVIPYEGYCKVHDPTRNYDYNKDRIPYPKSRADRDK